MNTYDVISRLDSSGGDNDFGDILAFECPVCGHKGTHFILDQDTKEFFCSYDCIDIYKEYKQGIITMNKEVIEQIKQISASEADLAHNEMINIKYRIDKLTEVYDRYNTKYKESINKVKRFNKLEKLIDKKVDKI